VIKMRCPFCNYIDSNTTTVLLKNRFTYVIPDFSPIVAGHILILPYKHTHGIANMDSAVVLDFCNTISYIERMYGCENGIFFEHGSVIPSTAGNSVDHTHLHFLPVNIHLEALLAREEFDLNKMVPIRHLSELKRFSRQCQSYIFWKYLNGAGAACPVEHLKSQFLRFTIGNTLDKTQNYDWHSDSLTGRAKILVAKTIDDWNMRSNAFGK